jgi:hypothetical protein
MNKMEKRFYEKREMILSEKEEFSKKSNSKL